MIAPGRRSKCSRTSSAMRAGRDALRPEALDRDRDRVRDADRVGDLHLAAVGEACGDDVLRHVARRVGGRAVDLGRVLPGERAAAVAGRAAVRVDDDLAPGEAGVAHRPAGDELPRRVDEDEVALLEAPLVVELARKDRVEDVLDHVGLDERVRVEAVAVLGRDEDALDLDRPLGPVLVDLVADGHLRLAVRAQVREDVWPSAPRRAGGRSGARA